MVQLKQRCSRVIGVFLTAVSLLMVGCATHDSLSGYYQLQVNPAPDAPAIKQAQTNMLFGMDRLSFNDDHTYRFGPVSGEWDRVGTKVTLTPTLVPKTPPYADTTMADAISVLLQKSDFTASADGKTLRSTDISRGTLVFEKKTTGLK